MTPEQIDQRLADWQGKVALISQNLIALQELPTYQRLTGEPGFPPLVLTGLTATQVTPALKAMNDLFQHFELLLRTVERATELRKQMPRFLGSEQKLEEIEHLLTGASIQLPVVQIPLAQRGLLTAAETATAIRPSELLAAMTDAFQIAKEAVLAVEAAWASLAQHLAEAETDLSKLQQQAAALGVLSGSELESAHQAIAALRDRIDSDPLGASTDLQQQILSPLAQVRATLAQQVQQRTQAEQKLASAHACLKQLREVHGAAIAAFAECQEKVAEHPPMPAPLPAENLEALSQWLTRLETKLAQGLVQPVQIGLDNWLSNAKTYLAQEETTLAANRLPLDTRRELRGRLDALKAKAFARGLAEDPTLATLAAQAKQLLFSCPTPLDRASALVIQYEKRLNGH